MIIMCSAFNQHIIYTYGTSRVFLKYRKASQKTIRKIKSVKKYKKRYNQFYLTDIITII